MHYFSMFFISGCPARSSFILEIEPSSSTSVVYLALVSTPTNLCTRRFLAPSTHCPSVFRSFSTPCFFGHRRHTTTIFEEYWWMSVSSHRGGKTLVQTSCRNGLESQSTCVSSGSTSVFKINFDPCSISKVHRHASRGCKLPCSPECEHSAVGVGRSHCYLCLYYLHHRVLDCFTPAGASNPKIWS
jgi:hypothetical protein